MPEEDSLRTFLQFFCNEKDTVVARMHASFNWAFVILSVFAVGIVARAGFPKDYLSLFLLATALVLLSHFFVRTCKDYVNQIRFTALEKHCLASLLSLKIGGGEAALSNLRLLVDKYFLRWESPKPRAKVIRKTLFEHGFFALFSVVLTLIAWVAGNINWHDIRPIAVVVVAALLIYRIVSEFGTYYFKCDGEEVSMRDLD